MGESFVSLLDPVFNEVVLVVELVSSDSLSVCFAVSYDCDLVVEGDDSKFPIFSSISHVDNLLFNGCLQALHSTDVSNILLLMSHELIRTITEFHKILHLFGFVSLDLELALNWLRAAHGPTHIDAEHNRDFFISKDLGILNLGCSFDDVVDLIALWLLLFFNVNLVFLVAEFTLPDHLLSFFSLALLGLTVLVEDSLTLSTEYWVSSS